MHPSATPGSIRDSTFPGQWRRIPRDEINDGIWARRLLPGRLQSHRRVEFGQSQAKARSPLTCRAKWRFSRPKYVTWSISISRGAGSPCGFSVHAGASPTAARMHLNVPLAKAYARELSLLARQLKLPSQVSLDHLVRAPGRIPDRRTTRRGGGFLAGGGKRHSKKALAQLVKMREREGAHLAQDLTQRISIMRSATAKVQKEAPQVRRALSPAARRTHQERRPGSARRRGMTVCSKKWSIFADRSDVSEETGPPPKPFSAVPGLPQIEGAGGQNAGFFWRRK